MDVGVCVYVCVGVCACMYVLVCVLCVRVCVYGYIGEVRVCKEEIVWYTYKLIGFLTGIGSLPFSNLIVRSSTPELRADIFLPSPPPPASKMFCTRAAMSVNISTDVPRSWAKPKSLHQQRITVNTKQSSCYCIAGTFRNFCVKF